MRSSNENIRVDIQEMTLDIFSKLFAKEGRILKVSIVSDNIVVNQEYSSDSHFLCKFHGTTFGVNEKGVMKPEIEFSIPSGEYNLNLVMEGQSGENVVKFTEKNNNGNSIMVEIS